MIQHKLKIVTLLLVGTLFSCETDFVPHSKGYNRIELPEHKYVKLQEKHPYSFEHSVYATVSNHKSAFTEPHWIDVYYPNFDASVQLTYKVLGEKNDKNKQRELVVNEMTNDARKLTSQHNVKAFSIEEIELNNENGIASYVFELEGDVPSQFQFYATDSSKNFLRGALYFKTATKNDSLAPVIEFIKLDVVHMLNTLEWVD